ncbi:MAG: lytic transglycosylase domain-containing protein [Bryobacterales bacterium]|nr:lytic transglycosylase domain-containing protein [Bryobacterales bacterium]
MSKQSGNAIQRQTSSVQRQLGGARRGTDGFFVSSWFSDAPTQPLAAQDGFPPPGECEPLESTIAEAFMRESAMREGVSLDLVREVVRRESGFLPCAVSPKGAMGMMQLMPDTAEALGVGDPFDPRANIDGGVRLLRRLMDKYNGRPDLALAAYNAGEGAVDKANGVPDYAETREYVSAIMQKVFETPPNRARRPAATGVRPNGPGGSAPGSGSLQRNTPARITPPATAIPPVAPPATTDAPSARP